MLASITLNEGSPGATTRSRPSLVAGLYFPVALLPQWIRWASDVQPLAPATELLRWALVGQPLTDPGGVLVLKLYVARV